MNKLNCLIFLLFAITTSNGQNLVPNGDFEQIGNIPCGWSSQSQFDSSVVGWNTPTTGTPDAHSTLIPQSCSNHHPNSTFNCNNGSQLPLSGDVFLGFYTFAQANIPYREYVQAHLTAPLIPGIQYNVEIYVSLGENSQYATNHIGVGFSTTQISTTNFLALGMTPQVLFTNSLTDTVNWMYLKNTFIPALPYEYIIIGNFYDEISSNPILVNPLACWDRSYYYLENVSVTVDSTVGISENTFENTTQIYPNPFNKEINIRINDSEFSEFTLYDIAAKQILQQNCQRVSTVNTEHLGKGVYFYEVRNKKGLLSRGKIIKAE